MNQVMINATFDGSRVLGKAGKSSCSLVLHSVTRCAEQLKDTPDPARSVFLVRLAVQPYDVDDRHLEQLVEPGDLVVDLAHVLDRAGHSTVGEEDERIAFARGVALRREEGVDELCGVGDEVLVFAVDRVHREHRVLAHIRVAVLQAGAHDRNQRLEQLGVARDLLEEAQSCASDVLVRVLLHLGSIHGPQLDAIYVRGHFGSRYYSDIQYHVTTHIETYTHDKNHLLLELPILIVLWADLPIEMQQLLELLVS